MEKNIRKLKRFYFYNFISMIIIGLGIGYIVGLSANPVIQTVVSSLFAIISAIILTLLGINYKSIKIRHINLFPFAVFILFFVMGCSFGVIIRTNDLLGQDIRRTCDRITKLEGEKLITAEVKKELIKAIVYRNFLSVNIDFSPNFGDSAKNSSRDLEIKTTETGCIPSNKTTISFPKTTNQKTIIHQGGLITEFKAETSNFICNLSNETPGDSIFRRLYKKEKGSYNLLLTAIADGSDYNIKDFIVDIIENQKHIGDSILLKIVKNEKLSDKEFRSLIKVYFNCN